MGGDDDFVLRGHVAVCRYCRRVADGTAAFALDHYRQCVAPREDAKRIFGNNEHPLRALVRAKRWT